MELLAVLLGWGLAVVSGIAAYFAQAQIERRRIRREREVEEAAQALELIPAIGHGWWLRRNHEPPVVMESLTVWNEHGFERDTTKNFIEGMTLEVGTRYGLGVDVHVGEYIELHWTENAKDCQDGTRISDPEGTYSLRRDGPGH